MHLILESTGSKTPATILFLHLLFIKSNPVHLSSAFLGSSLFYWAAACKTLNLEIKSETSKAAFEAKTLGITVRASQYSAIAIYSLLSKVLAKSSKWTPKAISTAPPPATTAPLSNVLLTTHKESCKDLFLYY
jgi:hypothetical protein